MAITENVLRPRIFFSYSYEEKDLEPILQEVSENQNVEPLFADRIEIKGATIAEKIRSVLSTCDLVITIVRKGIVRPWVLSELEFASKLGKPVWVFNEQSSEKTDESSNKQLATIAKFYFYSGTKGLYLKLSSALNGFKRYFYRKDQVDKHKEERRDFDKLSTDLSKNVLILGKDSDKISWDILLRIETVVTEKGYNPILMKKLGLSVYESLEQKMMKLALNSRCVVLEDSRPSGAIDELKICSQLEIVTAILKEAGMGSTVMQFHYPYLFTFMKRFCYFGDAKMADGLCGPTYETLERATEEGLDWADDHKEKLAKLYGSLYSQFKN